MGFKVKFWGVRGSIACPSPNHVVYGGNTSCIELALGDHCVILDAGTGIRSLGHEFLRRGGTEATLLLTHTHWDHINGFPFFAPAFSPKHSFDIRAGHLSDRGGIQAILASQMAHPLFPVPLGAMQAHLSFSDFRAGETFTLYGDVVVRTAPLRHPNEATGYRIDHGGVSLAYVTDTEHVPGHPDRNVLDLIEGADLVIYDCTYTDDEFPAKVGWGHSTWQEGVRLCRAANVGRMVVFHHEPDHDDAFMERLEDEARRVWSGVIVGRDNMELTLA
ncbi:MAG: MBL fold metallo-hydrolase [Alphaproteobacteria bacterium]|nr:MBL fold metallo-hydrolase [Alphaproteobacteria bacterium]